MSKQDKASNFFTRRRTAIWTTVLAATALSPRSASAQISAFDYFPGLEDGAPIYITATVLLVVFIAFIALMVRRVIKTTGELNDITGELDATRQRLLETGKQLERTEEKLDSTERYYDRMLSVSEVGIFEVDLMGKCTFINNALQSMSGLYQKKVDKEGIASGIHPDDRKEFLASWDEFTKSGKIFEHKFRFLKGRNKIAYAHCRATKMQDADKKVTSYVGWVTDMSEIQSQSEKLKKETTHLMDFIDETVEGFYRLLPDAPILLSTKSEKNAELLMERLKLAECSSSFAAIYGAEPSDLIGKTIKELKGGCGPFTDEASMQAFIENKYKGIEVESARLGAQGTRIVLKNNVTGIIEEKKFVGIWGTVNDISNEKREQAELQGEINFLNRILAEIPADVNVKDTRCRFMFASDKLVKRTGIPKKEWLGKTIFEILPATPKDHDISAVETMKTGKITRAERPFDVNGKSGWMETIQKPLVSENGLVEGVISMSLDISGKTGKLHDAREKNALLEKELKHTKGELAQSRIDFTQTAAALSEATQKLKVHDAENAELEKGYQQQIEEVKANAESLRQKEQALLGRQQQLEEQLGARLEKLDAETNKRMKWEELLSIKEDELRKIEEHTAELRGHYEQETTLRKELEHSLEESRSAQEKFRKRVEETDTIHEQELRTLSSTHLAKLESEMNARVKMEKQLERTTELLQQTQEKMRIRMDEHTKTLDQEVKERKAKEEQLAHRTEELDTLRKDFNSRIEEETKSMKQELSLKQIREKALKQESKELEKRLHDLEQTLKTRNKEIQEKGDVEAEKKSIEKKIEIMSKQQESKIALEKEKLNLSIADIRMNELKLRKKTGDLQQQKEILEKNLEDKDAELEKLKKEIKKTEAALDDAQSDRKKQQKKQSDLLADKTKELNQQIADLQKSQQALEEKVKGLEFDKKTAEKGLEKSKEELSDAAAEYRKVADALSASQEQLKEFKADQKTAILSETSNLNAQIQELRSMEGDLKKQEHKQQERIAAQQEELNNLKTSLQTEKNKREKAEASIADLETSLKAANAGTEEKIGQQTAALTKQTNELKQSEDSLTRKLQAASEQITKRDVELAEMKKERQETTAHLHKLEQKLATIKQEHQTELRESVERVKEINRKNENLIDELSNSFKNSLTPMINTTRELEKGDNLFAEQKKEIHGLNHSCHLLLDMMKYRRELTNLEAHSEDVKQEEFDLHVLLADIDHRFNIVAQNKQLFFAVSYAQSKNEKDVPRMVKTDGEKVKKVLSILLGYAVDRTAKGRVGLHASRKADDTGKVRIDFELAFTGTESKDSLLTSVFAEESQVVDMEHGLTLAKAYAELLGGTFELEDRKEGVTALMLEIPFDPSSTADLDDNRDNGAEQAGAA
jgi:PAS domain S-box-containing protein